MNIFTQIHTRARAHVLFLSVSPVLTLALFSCLSLFPPIIVPYSLCRAKCTVATAAKAFLQGMFSAFQSLTLPYSPLN